MSRDRAISPLIPSQNSEAMRGARGRSFVDFADDDWEPNFAYADPSRVRELSSRV